MPSDRADDGTPIRLVLYVRRPVAGERTVAIDRLSALAAAGVVDEFEIETVQGEVILSEGGDDDTADLQALAAWSAGDVRSTLSVETRTSRLGRSVRTIALPEVTLAVYEGDTLAWVFPCTDGTRTWSVADCFDGYETAESVPQGVS
ncbi:HTH domain-containing protein [Halarchaeum nitratireducens]|uniref:Uncharacterized protein n=1 Tax=Halarchaeum nitratireducens TaxID=489913 RepID=A0A830G929_9EURY|nr:MULTISPECIES: HTH domain-containing protein [Halarchaeum]MBP2249949.1 hypothetical protein [Halarchaeum solikamskense]GGN09587.1 hypothetical protein GCM10009021_06440 [Halarchaeum nitratireducens]